MVTGKLKRVLTLGALLCLVPSAAFARQAAPLPNAASIEEWLESAGIDPETEGGTELIEWLHALLESPIDLNHASADELVELPFVDVLAAASVIAFRNRFGRFDHKQDLLAVEGWTEEMVRLVAPFITVSPRASDPPMRAASPARPAVTEPRTRVESLHRVGRRIDTGRGYDADTSRTTYMGSPYRAYTRIRATHGRRLQANLTLEKDPGEPFGWDTANLTYGFDFASGHIALRDAGMVSTVLVGDFNVETGQGLVFWRGTGFSKGPAATRAPVKNGRGVTTFSSSDASRFFRGVAAYFHPHGNFSAGLFAARTRRDATIDSLTVGGEHVVTSTSLTGLHRTPSELRRKGALLETMFGGRLQYAAANVQIGATAYRAEFDKRHVRGNPFYRHFHFEGERHTLAGIDARVHVAGLQVFGEAAYGGGGPPAAVGGVLSQPADRIEVLLMARHYPPSFHSPFGHGFGERSGATQNETGFYGGVAFRPADRWRISGYFDQFRFPWLRFGVYRPTAGYDMLSRIEFRPDRRSSIYVQFRNRLREESASTGNGLHHVRAVEPVRRTQLRLHGETRPSDLITLRGRIELARFSEPSATKRGFLVFQDVRWRPLRNLMIDARAALFSTDGFDARIYAYEYDLLNVFSVPVFFGEGQRQYVLIRYDLNRTVSLWAKVMETRWEHIRSFGSGLDETEGNRLREYRLQLRLRL